MAAAVSETVAAVALETGLYCGSIGGGSGCGGDSGATVATAAACAAGMAGARDDSESRHPAGRWKRRVAGRSTRPVTLIHATERVTRIHATLAFECRRRSTRPVP